MSVSSYTTAKGETRYRVRFTTPDGKRTDKRGFMRKRDAMAWQAEHVTTAKYQGTFVDVNAANTTVAQLYDAWIARKKVSGKPSYIRTLQVSYDKYVAPTWGRMPVSKVNKPSIQQWVAEISNGTGYHSAKSPTVVHRVHGILAGILDDAVDARLIMINPARGVDLPRKARKTKHTYLSAKQLIQLAEACGRYRPVILLLGTTGLRWGEMAALKIKDVDPVRHRLDVYESATLVARKIVVTTPKTHEIRSVMYPAMLDDLLDLERDGEELLFPATNGGYMGHVESPKTGTSWFTKACDLAGVQRMTIHDLRHTAASIMVRSGANVKTVQRQLGHASAAMTLDVYADLFDDDLDDLRVRMDSVFEKCGQNVGNSDI